MKKTIIGIIALIVSTMVISCAGEEVRADVKTPTIQCGMCQKTIEKGLGKVTGVTHSKVDLKTKTTHIVYDKSKVTMANIEKAISDLGYQANETLANPVAYEALPGCCKIGGGH